MGNDQSCCFKYVCCGRKLASVTLLDFLDRAETGDVVLFNQNSMASKWKCCTRSEWNHIGLVINTPSGVKFLVEAIQPQVIAWRLDKAMDAWLNPENTIQTVWRQLRGVKRSSSLVRSIHKFTSTLQGRPYEDQWLELIGAILRQDSQRCCRKPKAKKFVDDRGARHTMEDTALDENEMHHAGRSAAMSLSPVSHDVDMMAGVDGELHETTQALFCSELVAFYYQQAGWMDKELLPWLFLPKDFADYRNANVPYHLKEGISLGPMVTVEVPESLIGSTEVAKEVNPIAQPPSRPKQDPGPLQTRSTIAQPPSHSMSRTIQLKSDTQPTNAVMQA